MTKFKRTDFSRGQRIVVLNRFGNEVPAIVENRAYRGERGVVEARIEGNQYGRLFTADQIVSIESSAGEVNSDA